MSKSKVVKVIKNKRGQGMIEYLILVALVAAGTIGVVKVVGQNVRIQYENINRALGAPKKNKLTPKNAEESETDQKDLSSFMEGTR